MSDSVTVLAGKGSSGLVEVADAGLQGMITLRGEFASPNLKNAATGISGVDFPDQGEVRQVEDRGLAWMSPDELLVLVPYSNTTAALRTVSETLGDEHHLAVDVSDARAVFRLTGNNGAIREVLAKLTPADVSPKSLPVGHVRRTRMAQVPAAVWFVGENEAIVICFRSVADYVFGLLTQSSMVGSEVGYFP